MHRAVVAKRALSHADELGSLAGESRRPVGRMDASKARRSSKARQKSEAEKQAPSPEMKSRSARELKHSHNQSEFRRR
jgi:hypothetical protein